MPSPTAPPIGPAPAATSDTDTAAALTCLLGAHASAALARLRGDAPRLLRLLRQFVQHQQADADRLVALLQAPGAAGAQPLAHELKGAAATLGAGRLAELALAVELGLRRGEAGPSLLPPAQALQAEMRRLAAGLAALPAHPVPA